MIVQWDTLNRWVYVVAAAALVIAGCGDDSSDAGGATGGGAMDMSSMGGATGGGAAGGMAGGNVTDMVNDMPDVNFTTQPCETPSPAPYPAGSTYLGVHAGPLNNDLVPCDTATSFAQAWHVLQGYAIAQPNTFSPDGATTYVTTSQPRADACTVFAIDIATGMQQWCVTYPNAVGSSVEVDADGNLFVTGDGSILSLDPEGNTRWETTITGPRGEDTLAVGLHFLPSGEIATVTGAGEIVLVSRADGSVLATFDIYNSFSFERGTRMGLGIDVAGLVPDAIVEDFATLFGSGAIDELLAVFTGSGDQWTDNTIGIAADGTIYAIGSGVTIDDSALIQVKVDTTGDAPQLTAGWYMPATAGSATSPSISQDGRYVKIADGNSSTSFVAPGAATATVRIADVSACDNNTDADPDPMICAPTLNTPLRSGPALGASPIYNDAEHYIWDTQLASLIGSTVPDVTRYDGESVVWETTLPDDANWSSGLTITNNHIIGTITSVTASDTTLLTLTLPATAKSELAILDRATGELVFRAPVTDDATATVTVGPDGSIYVVMVCLLHVFAVDTPVVGGLIRFGVTSP